MVSGHLVELPSVVSVVWLPVRRLPAPLNYVLTLPFTPHPPDRRPNTRGSKRCLPHGNAGRAPGFLLPCLCYPRMLRFLYALDLRGVGCGSCLGGFFFQQAPVQGLLGLRGALVGYFFVLEVLAAVFLLGRGDQFSQSLVDSAQRLNAIPSSRNAFPYPLSIVCFLRFHWELFRFVPQEPTRSVGNNNKHFCLDFRCFHTVQLACDCSSTWNRHLVSRKQGSGTGFGKIDCGRPQMSVSGRRYIKAHDLAYGFHVVNWQGTLIGERKHS